MRPSFTASEPIRQRKWLWLAPAALILPKCLLCVFAYTAVGAALGLNSPELCGAVPEDDINGHVIVATALGVGVLGGIMLLRRRQRT